MKVLSTPWVLKAIAVSGGFIVVLTGIVFSSQRVGAQNDTTEAKMIRMGLKIAPVPLNMQGKNPDLVGLGSYIVNAQADCNGCHGPQNEFVNGGNPFFGQSPAKVSPVGYLAGGQDFGTLDEKGLSFDIMTRNLTPDKTGLAEGGASFDDFRQRMRHGTDLDKFHPTCTGALNAGCIPPPFDGGLLQIMPWPTFANMSDHELRAIYEYLSAIPCVEGDPGNPAGADTKGTRCK